jgi:hypothetical protein
MSTATATAVVPVVASRGIPVMPAENVPHGLRVGAGFAAFFGTLWFVQGAAAAAGPVAAALALLPGLGIATVLVGTRRAAARAPRVVNLRAHRAARWVGRATLWQLAVSIPGGVAVELLVDRTALIPFVVLTVGVYLLALAPVIGRVHLWVAGTLPTVVPLVTWTTLDGTAVTAATGLVAGAIFLLKAATDLVVSRRGREERA